MPCKIDCEGEIEILTESSQFCRLYVFVVFDSDMFENANDQTKQKDTL